MVFKSSFAVNVYRAANLISNYLNIYTLCEKSAVSVIERIHIKPSLNAKTRILKFTQASNISISELFASFVYKALLN